MVAAGTIAVAVTRLRREIFSTVRSVIFVSYLLLLSSQDSKTSPPGLAAPAALCDQLAFAQNPKRNPACNWRAGYATVNCPKFSEPIGHFLAMEMPQLLVPGPRITSLVALP